MGISLDTQRPRPPPKAAFSRPGIRFVDVVLARLRVRETGSGAPLLFLADAPNVIEHYDTLLEHVTDHRCVVVEMPGFGFSQAFPGFGYGVTQTVEVLAQLCAALELKNATVVAPCSTGLLMPPLVRAAPGVVGRLILPQTPSWEDMAAWANRVDRNKRLRTRWLGQGIMWAASPSVARSWYRAAAGSAPVAEAMTQVAVAALRSGAQFPLASLMQAMEADGAVIGSAPVDVPLTVLWGHRDRSHKGTNPRGGAAASTRSNVIEHADCGHFPELEAPDRFARLLAQDGP